MRLALACLALACSSSHGGPRVEAVPTKAVAVLPDVPFADLDHDQRLQFMRDKVVPALAPVFRQHDAQKFAEFGCATCHGAAAVASGTFAMPSDKLPALDVRDLTAWKARDVELMERVVVPAMQKLLRAPDGWGCLGCHAAK
jgi:mono/diheme cytochrome c family protein